MINEYVTFMTATVCLFISCPSTFAGNPTDVQLLQIVVLDTSSSMDHPERLEVAKKEIKSKADNIPPSQKTPWVVITFGSTVETVREFSDRPEEIQGFLDNVQASGGTNIAAALKQAVDIIKTHSTVKQLVMYLFTDGEDPNLAAINEQETRLEKVLGARADNGLSQTLICRRWGNANAGMVSRLSKLKHLRIIESNNTPLAQISLSPSIAATGCHWNENTIRIELSASISAKEKNDVDLPVVRLECTTQHTSGDTEFELIPGSKAKTFIIDINPPPGEIPKIAELTFFLKVCHHDAAGNVLLAHHQTRP